MSEASGRSAPISAAIALARSAGARGGVRSPHSGSFRAVTAALLAVALAAVILAAGLLSSGGKAGPQVTWSEWSPADGGTLGAREIADYLAPFYRISGVNQLAVVTVANLSTPSATSGSTGSTSTSSGLQVAVRLNPSSAAVTVLGGNTIAYNLCGIGGANCMIGVGRPSTDRLLLLRREALELALYTFKYIGGTQNVVAILPPANAARTRPAQTSTLSRKPPAPSSAPANAPLAVGLLFVHGELNLWLSQPLANTLPEQFPPSVSQIANAPEAPLVDQLTARGLFTEHMVQAQDGSNMIMLDPLPPQ